MRKYFVFLIVALFYTVIQAQDFKAQYVKAYRDKDTSKQKEIIMQWQNSEYKDADYYLYAFSFFQNGSFDELSRKLDIEALGRSFDILDGGIEQYPQRLDLRAAKIQALYNNAMWDDYTKEIIKAVDYSYIADNKWIYPNEKADKEFFLNLVQQYQADLLDETDAELFSYEDSLQVIRIRKISEAVLKYYPDNTEALNNLGVSYYLCLDYPKALEIFLKAEKLNPKDAVIKFNIANLYAKTGDKPRAKQYYKTLTDNFTGEVAQKAAELIKELE